MKRTVTVIALLAFGVLFEFALAAQKSAPDAQLGFIIQAAEVEGHYEAAIDRYRQFIDANRSNRALAAKAKYHLGLAYEKLNNPQAETTYEQLAREYAADQPTVAAGARQRLEALSASKTKNTLSSPRRIPITDINPFESGLSLGGRLMASIDWETNGGDIAIRDLESGKLHRLIVKGTALDTAHWALLSPGGDRVAYLWETPDALELRLMPNERGAPSSVLLSVNPGLGGVMKASWFPDGKSLLAPIFRNDTFELARVPANGDPIQVLTTGFSGAHPSISPDGKYIAYSAPAVGGIPPQFPKAAIVSLLPALLAQMQEADLNYFIYVLAVDRPTVPVLAYKAPGLNQFPFWVDNTHVLFTNSKRDAQSRQVLALEVRDGKPVGSARVVLPEVGDIEPLGVTRSGAYYYVRDRGSNPLFTVTFDPERRTIRGAAVRLVEGPLGAFPGGWSCAPSWSPDGARIAFKRNSRELVVHTLATGREEKHPLVNSGEPFPIPCGFPLVWLPDGKSLLAYTSQRSRRRELVRVETTSGQSRGFEADIHASLPNGVMVAVSPDERNLYFIANGSSRRAATISTLDLINGRSKEIWSAPPPIQPSGLWPPALAPSPDGRMLATILDTPTERRLVLLAADGSGYREIFVSPRLGQKALAWTRDGRALLTLVATQTVDQGLGQYQLMRIPAEGGMPEYTGLTVTQDNPIALSRDGLTIAFSERVSSQLWVVDNLSSFLRTTQ